MAAKVQTVTAWSYSRYTNYKECPFKFKCKFIDKIKEPQNDAMLRGIKIHQEAEDYLKHKTDEVPESLKKLEEDFVNLRNEGAIAEEQWAVTSSWEETGYFDKDTWLRLKIDSRNDITVSKIKVIDFKTGKIRDGYEEQLELYATAAFSIFDIKEVRTELWYVDHGVILGNKKEEQETFTFKQKDYKNLLKLWEGRVKAMMNATRYTPTPNYTCQWCFFSKNKGGPCKF